MRLVRLKKYFYLTVAGAIVVLILFNFNFFPVQAAFNKQINYQGKLTDTSGTAVADGAYNAIFKLYTAASGGVAIWTESWTSAALFSDAGTTYTADGCAAGVDKMAYTSDTNEGTLAAGQYLWNTTKKESAIIQSVSSAGAGGYICVYDTYSAWSNGDTITNRIYAKSGIFSTMLGTITSISSVDFNQTLYLGVTIGSDSEMKPRKSLGAVPAAFEADKVDGLDTGTAGGTSAYLLAATANGNFVITGDPQGTGISQGSLYINPATAGAGEMLFGIADNGTAHFSVLKEGYVGIGTATPTAPLDVRKAVTATGGSAVGVYFAQTLTAAANDDNLAGLYINPTFDNNSKTDIADMFIYGQTSMAGEVMSIFSNTSADAAAYSKLYLQTDAGLGGLALASIASGDSFLNLYSDTSEGINLMSVNTDGVINFFTGGINKRMGINKDGDVSIGPLAGYNGRLAIHDAATADERAALFVSQTGAVVGTGYAGHFIISGASTTNVGALFSATGATNNYAALFRDGNVAIGNDDSPTAALVVGNDFSAGVSNGAGDVYIQRDLEADGQIYFLSVYSDNLNGSTYRDLLVKDDGQLGYDSSSIQYKTNVEDMENINWLYNLRPVNFQYKEKDENGNFLDFGNGVKKYGLIAEEVEQINDSFVFYNIDANGNKIPEGVQYRELVPPMIKALQDQKAEIKILQNSLNNLQNDPNKNLNTQNLVVSGAEFNGKVMVKGEMAFNKDTAGGARILAGGEKVDVVFEKEYEYTPIVNITLSSPVKLDYYIVNNVSKKGFTIEISPAAGAEAINFSWHATSVDGPKIFVSDGTIEDYTIEVKEWSDYFDYYDRVPLSEVQTTADSDSILSQPNANSNLEVGDPDSSAPDNLASDNSASADSGLLLSNNPSPTDSELGSGEPGSDATPAPENQSSNSNPVVENQNSESGSGNPDTSTYTITVDENNVPTVGDVGASS